MCASSLFMSCSFKLSCFINAESCSQPHIPLTYYSLIISIFEIVCHHYFFCTVLDLIMSSILITLQVVLKGFHVSGYNVIAGFSHFKLHIPARHTIMSFAFFNIYLKGFQMFICISFSYRPMI